MHHLVQVHNLHGVAHIMPNKQGLNKYIIVPTPYLEDKLLLLCTN
jgi:hypothetical protein